MLAGSWVLPLAALSVLAGNVAELRFCYLHLWLHLWSWAGDLCVMDQYSTVQMLA